MLDDGHMDIVRLTEQEYRAARDSPDLQRKNGEIREAEYNARLSELDEACINGPEDYQERIKLRYKVAQSERMEKAQRRMREAIVKRDRFGVKLLEKGDTGDYVIARMENGVTMQKIILSPLEARLLAAGILSKVKPIKRKKKSWNIK